MAQLQVRSRHIAVLVNLVVAERILLVILRAAYGNWYFVR